GHGNRGDVGLLTARDPVNRGVEVGAGVLTGVEVVPVADRSAFVVPTDLLEVEARGLTVLGRELQDRRVLRQRSGEIDDLDRTGRECRGEVGEYGHGDRP